jgi:hypothetical protein
VGTEEDREWPPAWLWDLAQGLLSSLQKGVGLALCLASCHFLMDLSCLGCLEVSQQCGYFSAGHLALTTFALVKYKVDLVGFVKRELTVQGILSFCYIFLDLFY